MDYSKTVNLLQTSFPMKADLPKREPLFLEKWAEMKLYELIQEKGKNKPVFLLHDGPPYANGVIHMGHALNKILKDFVVKYKSLQGYHSPYKPGWDCHGLPIEHALFKELGKNKHQVSRVELREKAAQYAMGFVDKQRQDFKRLGVFAEWENPYLTLSNEYEALIVETFFELEKKELIYRKLKPGYWCAFDETALAEAEVEYMDKKSDSVFVRFKAKTETIPEKVKKQLSVPNLHVLIWTTTPWTLPANVGLALHPDEKYVVIQGKDAAYLVAEKLKDVVAKKIGVECTVLGEAHSGKDYIGLLATNPIHQRDSRVVNATYVTMEDGTGIVHIAPGHGIEDFEVGLRWALDVISPVDERGQYQPEVGHPALVGKHVLKEANQAVMEILGADLVYYQPIKHSYPHCWRCKNPIIFRATKQWFLRVDDNMRKKLLEEIDRVQWIPNYGIHRIKGMVEQRPDWCLSRQRHWGAPIAVFYCDQCETVLRNPDVDRHLVQLFKKEGASAWYQKTETELLQGLNAKCGSCGSTTFKKEMDILDVWFDSGVSWKAVVEEHLSKPKPEMVMYLEGSDQHRGWFQTSLIPSVMLRDKAPFDMVLTHGFVVDGKGHKMSKSLGNVIAPQEIIQKYGADILRLWVAMSDYRDDVRLSNDIVNQAIDMYRRFRNSFRFLLQNTVDFKFQSDAVPFEKCEEIDRWILVHFEEVKARVIKAYEANEFHVVLSELNRFAAVPLSGFYFDALKDILYCEKPNSHRRRSTQTALYHLTRGLTLLLSPLISFTAEETYTDLRQISNPSLPQSVFLDEMANLPKVQLDEALNIKWQKILELRAKVNDGLDRERKAGTIKSSQEVCLTVNPQKFEEGFKPLFSDSSLDWAFLFQMAEVYLDSSGEYPESVTIKASEFAKCERCWRHRSDVGHSKEHPTLCGRCVDAIGDLVNI